MWLVAPGSSCQLRGKRRGSTVVILMTWELLALCFKGWKEASSKVPGAQTRILNSVLLCVPVHTVLSLYSLNRTLSSMNVESPFVLKECMECECVFTRQMATRHQAGFHAW